MSKPESSERFERTSVSLPAPLARRLRLEARASGRKISAVVREALEAHFASRGAPPLPSFIGIGRGDGDNVSERVEELIREAVRRTGFE